LLPRKLYLLVKQFGSTVLREFSISLTALYLENACKHCIDLVALNNFTRRQQDFTVFA
jgi:hypothetical protein